MATKKPAAIKNEKTCNACKFGYDNHCFNRDCRGCENCKIDDGYYECKCLRVPFNKRCPYYEDKE